jgi:hypothetical protein
VPGGGSLDVAALVAEAAAATRLRKENAALEGRVAEWERVMRVRRAKGTARPATAPTDGVPPITATPDERTEEAKKWGRTAAERRAKKAAFLKEAAAAFEAAFRGAPASAPAARVLEEAAAITRLRAENAALAARVGAMAERAVDLEAKLRLQRGRADARWALYKSPKEIEQDEAAAVAAARVAHKVEAAVARRQATVDRPPPPRSRQDETAQTLGRWDAWDAWDAGTLGTLATKKCTLTKGPFQVEAFPSKGRFGNPGADTVCEDCGWRRASWGFVAEKRPRMCHPPTNCCLWLHSPIISGFITIVFVCPATPRAPGCSLPGLVSCPSLASRCYPCVESHAWPATGHVEFRPDQPRRGARQEPAPATAVDLDAEIPMARRSTRARRTYDSEAS